MNAIGRSLASISKNCSWTMFLWILCFNEGKYSRRWKLSFFLFLITYFCRFCRHHKWLLRSRESSSLYFLSSDTDVFLWHAIISIFLKLMSFFAGWCNLPPVSESKTCSAVRGEETWVAWSWRQNQRIKRQANFIRWHVDYHEPTLESGQYWKACSWFLFLKISILIRIFIFLFSVGWWFNPTRSTSWGSSKCYTSLEPCRSFSRLF